MPDDPPLFRPGCSGRAPCCCRFATMTIPLVCTLLLAGCPGDSSVRDKPPAAPAAPSSPGADVPLSATATSPPPDKPQRAALDAHGVAFVDVARERGLRYAWPEQPRPIPIRETFGCGA